jgi:hypothetical protein
MDRQHNVTVNALPVNLERQRGNVFFVPIYFPNRKSGAKSAQYIQTVDCGQSVIVNGISRGLVRSHSYLSWISLSCRTEF